MKKNNNNKNWTAIKTKKNSDFKVSPFLNKTYWFLSFLIGMCAILFSIYVPLRNISPTFVSSVVVISIILLLVIIRATNEGREYWQFILSSYLEIKKVIWPSRTEVLNSTLIILAIVLISSIVIHLIGILFMKIVQILLK